MRSLTALAAGVLLAVAGSGPAHAQEVCHFAAQIGEGPPVGEGSTSLTVETGVQLTFWGTGFIPNSQVDLTFLHDGIQFGDFTPATADAEGSFLFVHDFQTGQEGEWRVVASVPDTECAGEVAVRVLAAGSTAAPSATSVPNTATENGDAPATDSIPATLAIVGVVLVAVGLLPRRRRADSSG
ncbi:MAG TPA: hypothetical protein VFH63_09160 [candidate division Zixibacteria bacterium]|nr:hypothetical protein [candidate division Zixibacteria bacterium]